MTDYEKALADARDALAIYRRYGAPLCGYATNAIDALDDLLAALDAAQPVAWMTPGGLDVADAAIAEAQDDASEEYQFLNHYRCPSCQHEWDSQWSATCDDECPNCGASNISPWRSEDL